MFLLPYARCTIKTILCMHDVIARLENVIEPQQFFRGFRQRGPRPKPYEGQVEVDTFSARSVIEYAYSFHPVIKGKITPEMGGCSVEMILRPSMVVLLFMALWVGSVGYAFLSALWPVVATLLQGGLQEIPALLPWVIPGAMLVTGYGLLWHGFNTQVHESESFFRTLLDANTAEEQEMAELFGED